MFLKLQISKRVSRNSVNMKYSNKKIIKTFCWVLGIPAKYINVAHTLAAVVDVETIGQYFEVSCIWYGFILNSLVTASYSLYGMKINLSSRLSLSNVDFAPEPNLTVLLNFLRVEKKRDSCLFETII